MFQKANIYNGMFDLPSLGGDTEHFPPEQRDTKKNFFHQVMVLNSWLPLNPPSQ